MSQFPPPPPPPPGNYPGNFPPPGSYPPPGYPNAPYGAPLPQKSNGAAVASLILGILGCVPLLGILAVILGFVGIGKSKSTGKGKGMAITGVLLGLFFTALYVAGIYGYATLIQPLVGTTSSFVEKLAAGDVSGARSFATSDVTEKDLREASDTFRSMGELKDLKLEPSPSSSLGDMRFTGKIVFEKGTKQVKVRITKQPDGKYKFTEFTVQ